MVTKGLLVRLEVKHGKDDEVESFLTSALPLVQQEAETKAWFAVSFGRSEYGIIDFFPGDQGRDTHLSGPIAKALMQRADELFASPPAIQKIDVLADKLPHGTLAQQNTKGILLTFDAKEGHEAEVAQFLKNAQPLVMEEEETTAWFAIHLGNKTYGIFDVFPDNTGRFKHLIGQVPKALLTHSLTLLGSIPDLDMLKVVAEHFNP